MVLNEDLYEVFIEIGSKVAVFNVVYDRLSAWPIIGLIGQADQWQADHRLKILVIGHRPIVHMIGRLLT